MYRLLVAVVAVLAAVVARSPDRATAADPFDLYTNPILAKVPKADGAREVKQLSRQQLIDHDRVLTGVAGAFLVVKTNDNRWSKLLVQYALHKVAEGKTIPMVSVERYVTFKEGEERAVQAASQNVNLYPGFRLSLDLGQVVPEDLGGDLRFAVEDGKTVLEPLGKAKVYLVTRPLPEAVPPKTEKITVGDKFEAKYFNGTYRLRDDGRRSGQLTLKVSDDGGVSGTYVSDKDGSAYEVRGRVGMPKHSIEFSVQFPRSEQTFKGWLFTADARAITGSSRLGDREAGFYAVRIEEK
jgi:hypothetical protein